MAIEVKVPTVGESITEVFIGEWYKSEGDEVGQDENLVEVESEKATFDVPAPGPGVISEILKKAGDKANVGDVIAYIEKSGAKVKKKGDGKEPEMRKPETTAPPASGGKAGKFDEARVMPGARRILEQNDVRGQVTGTGPGGRVLKEDAERHVREAGQAPAGGAREQAGRQEEEVPMSPIRRRIAARLVEAQQTAALLTTFNEVDLSAIQAMRAKYKDSFEKKYGVKLGFMSFFIKAAVDALKSFPELNAEIRDDSIIYRNYYDIGIAIGGGKGLVVPVLRNTERMSFAEIEQAIGDFANRSKDNGLKPEELRGGTFTITNGGVYGSLLSTPIVNPPQSGVLGMHAVQDRPVVVNGQIVVRPMMYVALTYDHRIVDGREAVTFLRRIKEAVEEPARMLVEI